MLFIASSFFLIYVWLIFPLLIYFVAHAVPRRKDVATFGELNISVTVVVAAHNEAANLARRVENICNSNYPAHLLEVSIVSDGSTDGTPDVVHDIVKKYPSVHFNEIMPQCGRANAHNIAVANCQSEVLVFTDADTYFDADTIPNLLRPFANPRVGFTSGELRYFNEKAGGVTESFSIYWKFEMILRSLESAVGVFVFGSGACCAVRTKLYRSIPPTGDVDFTTPLDVVLQGYRCQHLPDALAWDSLPASPKSELRARVRMTSKNLYGTFDRWGGVNVFFHPFYSWVIFSHKIGRWLTPFALLGCLVGTVLLMPSLFSFILLFAQIGFYLYAYLGYLGFSLPFASTVYSFCLANIGFFLGVINVFLRRVPHLYKPVSQIR